MLDFNTWLGTNTNTRPSATERAVAAWDRIQDKPSSITIKRGSTTLPAQTVRIEYNVETSEVIGATGISSKRRLTVFGIQDHPSEDDTNIQRGDQFAHEGMIFKVIDMIPTLGEIQARAEAIN